MAKNKNLCALISGLLCASFVVSGIAKNPQLSEMLGKSLKTFDSITAYAECFTDSNGNETCLAAPNGCVSPGSTQNLQANVNLGFEYGVPFSFNVYNSTLGTSVNGNALTPQSSLNYIGTSPYTAAPLNPGQNSRLDNLLISQVDFDIPLNASGGITSVRVDRPNVAPNIQLSPTVVSNYNSTKVSVDYSDDNSNILNLKFELSENPAFTNIVQAQSYTVSSNATQASKEHTFTNLNNGTTYYWRVTTTENTNAFCAGFPNQILATQNVVSSSAETFDYEPNSSSPLAVSGIITDITPKDQNVLTASTIDLEVTTSSTIPAGGIVEVSFPTSRYSGTAIPTFPFGTQGTISTITSGDETVLRLSVINPILAGVYTININGLTTVSDPSVNSWKVFATSNGIGSGTQNVGQANIVNVRGRVQPNLSLIIRDDSDTTDSNICDLDILTTTAVSECSYRLKVYSNAGLGYSISVKTSGGLSNGTDEIMNASSGSAGVGGTYPIPGTEIYGIKVEKGEISTGGEVLVYSKFEPEVGGYLAGFSNTDENTLISSSKPNNPDITDLQNTALITHQLTMSPDTPSGLYTQNVTYTVSPSF
jgi:hypothetical protein